MKYFLLSTFLLFLNAANVSSQFEEKDNKSEYTEAFQGQINGKFTVIKKNIADTNLWMHLYYSDTLSNITSLREKVIFYKRKGYNSFQNVIPMYILFDAERIVQNIEFNGKGQVKTITFFDDYGATSKVVDYDSVSNTICYITRMNNGTHFFLENLIYNNMNVLLEKHCYNKDLYLGESDYFDKNGRHLKKVIYDEEGDRQAIIIFKKFENNKILKIITLKAPRGTPRVKKYYNTE